MAIIYWYRGQVGGIGRVQKQLDSGRVQIESEWIVQDFVEGTVSTAELVDLLSEDKTSKLRHLDRTLVRPASADAEETRPIYQFAELVKRIYKYQV